MRVEGWQRTGIEGDVGCDCLLTKTRRWSVDYAILVLPKGLSLVLNATGAANATDTCPTEGRPAPLVLVSFWASGSSRGAAQVHPVSTVGFRSVEGLIRLSHQRFRG